MNIIELKNLSLSYKTKSFIPNDNKNLHLPKDEDFYALKDINSIEKKCDRVIRSKRSRG